MRQCACHGSGGREYRQEVFQVRSLRAHFGHGVDYGEYIRDLVACRPRGQCGASAFPTGRHSKLGPTPSHLEYDVLT